MSQQETGWGALLSGTNAIRSLALAGGVALHAINVYVATTILPSVVKDIGGIDYYAWNTTIFVATSILGSALSARLLGLAGPRGAYLVAALIFALGTLICGFAPSMPALLAGRAVQGFGGGFLFALSYAMIRIVFPETLWPRAMGLVSGMWGVATLIGPAIGGIFAEYGVWRAAFWSLAPVAVLFAVMAVAILPGRSPDRNERTTVPVLQLVLLIGAVLAVSAGSVSPDPIHNLLGLGAAIVLVALLIGVESRARNRLLPRGAFRPSTALGALFATMALLGVTVTGSEIFVPLFLQVLYQQTPLIAGYLAAVMSAGWTLGSISSSGAQGKGIDRAIFAAPLLSFVGMAALAVLFPLGSGQDWLLLAPICVAFAAIGLGVGIAWPHILTRIFKAAPADEQDITSASISTVTLFATAFGAALAGMVANLGGLIDPGGVTGTASASRWLFGLFALAPLVCFLTVRQVARTCPVKNSGAAIAVEPGAA
ncbi:MULTISPECIES: MFS transporter [Phyllobacteriaceae]|jgi:MFS family permease|uniref:MFS transporter n=1 Tax=Mesorhizobium hungaricum TaxID=1566387 RepID=A0A1C2DGG8_9HYPH|nr:MULTISPECIES: MFS transporter [Mesorhizobium]MBN9232283.1 MFS transporter [Mesorhizobium sp.]MDQ0329879.1 MFS family permease [Mesorhizobium sp. YL-MeA3-2017]OCX13859.1 MFS transporter [Mesorhizobium hungaricum]